VSEPTTSSIWPPPDFEVMAEERRIDAGAVRVTRRFRVRADGLAFAATATAWVVDPVTQATLPVFGRVAIYGLVETSLRALARGLDRTRIATIDEIQGERGDHLTSNLALAWSAFGTQRLISAQGRVHGPMADILWLLDGHMPEGERFAILALDEREPTRTLRGVPVPRQDEEGALRAYLRLVTERAEDRRVVEEAFALACHLGRRAVAEGLVRRWVEVTGEAAAAPGANGAGLPAMTSDVLRRMLPAP
jgi:hypothetical protein